MYLYMGLFRNKACNMHINVGEREACWIGVRLAVHDFVFNTECWDILFNENLDCEEIVQDLHTCPISSHSTFG